MANIFSVMSDTGFQLFEDEKLYTNSFKVSNDKLNSLALEGIHDYYFLEFDESKQTILDEVKKILDKGKEINFDTNNVHELLLAYLKDHSLTFLQ